MTSCGRLNSHSSPFTVTTSLTSLLMASAGRTQLGHQLARVANAWPGDPFRPNMQLKTFLQSLATHPNLTPGAVTAAEALVSDEVKRKVRLRTSCYCRAALTYMLQYPLSDRMLKPASMPHHYTRLNEGFTKAQQGIKRPWWKIFFNVW
jgi:hypothetical protein